MMQREHKNAFFSHTHPDEGGRFAVSDQPPRHLVGSTPAPRYPAGPSWSNDPTGIEPPTGVSIDEVIPVGEPHELAASLRETSGDAGMKPIKPLLDSPRGDGAPLEGPHLPSASAAPSSLPKGKSGRGVSNG